MKRIFVLLCILMLAGGCIFDGDDDKDKKDETKSVDQLEQEIFALVNKYRVENGMQALAWNDTLAATVRSHCRSAAAGETNFNEGTNDRRTSMKEILHLSRYDEAKFSIADSGGDIVRITSDYFSTALDAIQHQTYPPGPDPETYTLTGVGAAKSEDGSWYYFIQAFAIAE